jgi:hypothetical protein
MAKSARSLDRKQNAVLAQRRKQVSLGDAAEQSDRELLELLDQCPLLWCRITISRL